MISDVISAADVFRSGQYCLQLNRQQEQVLIKLVHNLLLIKITMRVGSMKQSFQRYYGVLFLGVLFAFLFSFPASAFSQSDVSYNTVCRCAPEQNEFCQGTLKDTDLFLSADGMLLHGAETSTCRVIWEYEFSAPIEKLAVDTTSQNIYFSSNKTVYALSLSKKELIYSQELSDTIRNISLQPNNRLSIDLVNGDRQYIDLTPFATSDSVANQQTIHTTKTNVYSTFNDGIDDSIRPDTVLNTNQTNSENLNIAFDSVAKIEFKGELNSNQSNNTIPLQPHEITSDGHKISKNKNDIKKDNNINNQKITHSKPQTIPLVEATKAAAKIAREIVLKPAKRGFNKDIYINASGYAMISMEYLVKSGLCSDCSIKDNIIKIKASDGQIITINNIHKTMQKGNDKPVGFLRQAKSYRTSNLEYYIPLRQVMELAGYQVNWSPDTKSIVVTT